MWLVGVSNYVDATAEANVSVFEGINTDLIVYTVIVPVIPFRLQALGYQNVSFLLGGLLLAYVGGILHRFFNRLLMVLSSLLFLLYVCDDIITTVSQFL